MSYIEALEPFLFDEDPEDIPPDLESKPRLGEYYQHLISKLDLVDEEQSRRLAYQIRLGLESQEAIDYMLWAELPKDEDFRRCQDLALQGERAKEKLIVGHLRLVAHIARLTMGWVPYGSKRVDERGELIFKGAIHKDLSQFSGAPLPLEDRIQIGTTGLMRAANKYDPAKRANFVTYSWYWIEHAIAKAIDEDQGIHIPVHILERCRKIGKASTRLLVELGREATHDELSEVTKLALGHVQEALEAQSSVMEVDSLSVVMPEEPEEAAVVEESFHSPWEAPVPYEEEYFEQVMVEEEVDLLLPLLKDRYQDILAMRYGFVTGDTMILEEIGSQIDVTPERVRQLILQSLTALEAVGKYRRLKWETKNGHTPGNLEVFESGLIRDIKSHKNLYSIPVEEILALHTPPRRGD